MSQATARASKAGVSQRKLEANRVNALRSTGPTSAEGKARASRNAVRHGLYSDRAVVGGEEAAEFEALREGMFRRLRPGDALEGALAERVVLAAWKLRRLQGAECHLFESFAQRHRDTHEARVKRYESDKRRGCLEPGAEPPIPPAEPMDPSWLLRWELTSKSVHALGRLEASLERSMHRALNELRRLQKERRESQGDEEAGVGLGEGRGEALGGVDPVEEEGSAEARGWGDPMVEGPESAETYGRGNERAGPGQGEGERGPLAEAVPAEEAHEQVKPVKASPEPSADQPAIEPPAQSKMEETNPPSAQATVPVKVIEPTCLDRTASGSADHRLSRLGRVTAREQAPPPLRATEQGGMTNDE